MKGRLLLSLAMSLSVTSIAGCALVTHDSGPTGCSDPLARPATVLTGPEMPTAPSGSANVVIQVNSALTESVRLRVQFAESLALDVRIPGTDARCATQPVYEYGYRLPPGEMPVTASSGNSQAETSTLHVVTQKRWLVIIIQKGFPLALTEWKERPAWG